MYRSRMKGQTVKCVHTMTFGGSYLNRAAPLRGTREQARLIADAKAQVLLIWRGKPLFEGGRLCWVPPAHDMMQYQTGDKVFLGLDDAGAPLFAADISPWTPEQLPDTLDAFADPSAQQHPSLGGAAQFLELRGMMTQLSARDGELAATARALLEWHRTHGFCGTCGGASVSVQGGWQRTCRACGRHHFPRTDPVVIMLVTHGNSLLVGRSPAWPEGMYSLLAGFIEPGETIEAAVRREVFEEAGVHVGPVRYLASQPWPFPASLMIGCLGQATSTDITIDPNELEDARWGHP